MKRTTTPQVDPARPCAHLLPLAAAECRRNRRNVLQRARRALDGAAAREARASRRSYWRKRGNYGHPVMAPGCCSVCNELREKHDL